jgi:hypothetical protein
MATASLATKKMPLPVELFYGAMERQVPLDDYARNIDLHPDILRQALTGRLQGADSHPLNALAKAINRDPEQLDVTTVPFEEAFSMWLKRNMEGITQHALRARAQLDTQTLKRFLNGNQLPDSDQAERISRALYIDRMEIARVITASMAAASLSIASQQSPEPRAMARQSNVSTELGASTTTGQLVTGTRRRRTSPRQASVEPATIDETVSARVEPDTVATGDPPIAGKRRKRASKPESQQAARVVIAMATHQPPAEFSSLPAAEAQEADRDGGPVPAAVHQAETLTSPAPAKTVTEKEVGTRRPKRSTRRDLASVAVAEQTPAETQTAADDRPQEGFAAEDRSSTQASSRRRSRTKGVTATDISTSGDVPPCLTAEIAPSKADERSAGISMDRTVPLVTAELAAYTTSLQLSADEVRLIRHWRQLHPHGRRATLQYIGSLLVDD